MNHRSHYISKSNGLCCPVNNSLYFSSVCELCDLGELELACYDDSRLSIFHEMSQQNPQIFVENLKLELFNWNVLCHKFCLKSLEKKKKLRVYLVFCLGFVLFICCYCSQFMDFVFARYSWYIFWPFLLYMDVNVLHSGCALSKLVYKPMQALHIIDTICMIQY